MFVEFCVPVYNEEQLLRANILTLWEFCSRQNFDFGWRIMIAVNGSTDNSSAIAASLSEAKRPWIAYMDLNFPGKGRAIKECLKRSRADVLVYMDIDLAVSLDNIGDLLTSVIGGHYNIAIASRLLPSSTTKRSFTRSISSQFYNFFARWILKDSIKDHQCGFKVLSCSTFDDIYSYVHNNHWFFDTELIAVAIACGYSVKEVPVDWEENRYDKRKSKVNIFQDGIKFMVKLLRLKLRINNQGIKKE